MKAPLLPRSWDQLVVPDKWPEEGLQSCLEFECPKISGGYKYEVTQAYSIPGLDFIIGFVM